VQNSLSAAGAGSLFVLADLLRLPTGIKARSQNGGLPPALRIVRQPNQRPSQGPLSDQVEGSRLQKAIEEAEQWHANNFLIDPPEWVYYYIYALERYQSFRELAAGQPEREPDWYNSGVEFLRNAQRESGRWDRDNGPVIDTCFGVMFLVRGTRKSIEKAAAFDGRLRGGRGLPGDTANVSVGDGGQIVKSPFQGKAESLLAILESAGADELSRSATIPSGGSANSSGSGDWWRPTNSRCDWRPSRHCTIRETWIMFRLSSLLWAILIRGSSERRTTRCGF
jgi:hypothetical protein